MCLALDVLEGQNFAGVDHDGVVPGESRAARLPAVDALDGHCELIGLRERLKGGVARNNSLVTLVDAPLTIPLPRFSSALPDADLSNAAIQHIFPLIR